MRVIEEIIIQASLEDVFQVVSDYQRWPEFLSVNKKVTLLKREAGQDFYEVFHQRNGTLEKSICVREEISKRHIRFQLTNPHFTYLKGEWILEPSGTGVKLISVHDFELKVPLAFSFIKGLLERLLVKRLFFDKTTPVTLQELKKRAEEKGVGRIAEK
ncbi:type II toxin-antitoxin system RatA family toxin [Desulforamulus ruminis]|uniref:Cyclase/dehydrase n=1 Tax=Desulforamulus ruminis (strain ATCC 23193 / DSM 2154 / NCIMB 8452 / DL) TaxID=696281 RepID=F6DKS3_DESRL|nr:SRPBCC family protein [Desulforamulus ruminis]AEG60448.1 cyclase/dehydrase [Desulforamulus ruminis DSM 2154]